MKRGFLLTAIALVMGAWLSFSFVRPVSASIELSTLILQLSGSRGEFPLFGSLLEILTFSVRLTPCFAFQALMGIWIYRHYCVASVYVFSRLPGRTGWYCLSALKIALAAAGFEFSFLFAACAAAVLRFEVVFDAAGWLVLACHFVLYTLWLYATTLLVNLLAIRYGSSTAFVAVVGSQLLLTALFYSLQVSQEPEVTAQRAAVLRWNPAACLVLGWQSGRWPWTVDFGAPYPGLYLDTSIIILLFFSILITAAGALFVKLHDLLLSDMESGGM